MMNREQALDFADLSACVAIDAWKSYAESVQDSIDGHRENVIDTLNDERASEHTAEALEVFDARVANLLIALNKKA